MTPEDRASKAMARCIAENGGGNMAFYLARAIKEAEQEAQEHMRQALQLTVAAMEATYSDQAEYADMSDAELTSMWNSALALGRKKINEA